MFSKPCTVTGLRPVLPRVRGRARSLRRSIDHLTPDCTGRWERARSRKRGPWRCGVCAVEHPETPLIRIAAVRENLLGTLLRLLETDGRVLRSREWE